MLRGLEVGGARERPARCPLQVDDGALGLAGLREVVRQQLGLALGRLGEALLQGRRDPAVQLLAPAPEQALVGGVAHQRVLEAVGRVRSPAPRAKISSAASSCPSASRELRRRAAATAARSSCGNSRPITAATCATSLTGASRSSRAMSESCSVDGDRQRRQRAGQLVAVARLASRPDSSTALVNSSTNSGTPSVRARIWSSTSAGSALPAGQPLDHRPALPARRGG